MILLTSGDNLLILPNPQIGEGKSINVKTTFGHAMDGKIYSHKYTPSSEKFDLSFSNVMQSKKDLAVAFFKAVAGQVIEYTDMDDVLHTTRLISDKIDFVYSGHGYKGTNMYNFDITLEVI